MGRTGDINVVVLASIFQLNYCSYAQVFYNQNELTGSDVDSFCPRKCQSCFFPVYSCFAADCPGSEFVVCGLTSILFSSASLMSFFFILMAPFRIASSGKGRT